MVQIRLAKAGTHYRITKPKKAGCSICTTFFGLFFSPSYSAPGGNLSVKRAAQHSGRQIYFAIAKTTSTIFLPNASAASGRSCFRENTDNRLRIALAQVHPFRWEVDFDAVGVGDLLIFIHFLYLLKDGVYVCGGLEVYTTL